MNNKTFWALKRREAEARSAVDAPRTRTRRMTTRKARIEDLPYRELQAKAKELEIPANQSADDLKAAITEADAE